MKSRAFGRVDAQGHRASVVARCDDTDDFGRISEWP
jgi:hypothetical protein